MSVFEQHVQGNKIDPKSKLDVIYSLKKDQTALNGKQ